MRAAVLGAQGPVSPSSLSLEEIPLPAPARDELLVKVEACGCCRTDLHVIEGDLPPVRLPLVPGHQVVGTVEAVGGGVRDFREGDRAGIAWLRHVDGSCKFCHSGRENLCPNARFTGYTSDGGYAEYALISEQFAYHLPADAQATQLAPLLCAGIIGYRALKRSRLQPGQTLRIYGFGSSAHVTIQVALHWGCTVYVATRGGSHRALAAGMGAQWTGDSAQTPPAPLDAAILFAPVGELVPLALRALDRGGSLAIAGIHLSDTPVLNYDRDLFYEKNLTSVTANTRQDGRELLKLAAEIPIRSRVEVFPLEEVNAALQKLKAGRIDGSAVIVP